MAKCLQTCAAVREAFWWDKNHPDCIYMDIREEEPGTIEFQPNWSVKPDVIGDYRDMFFDNETFHLIVWDTPHILEAKGGIMLMKYGKLGYGWKDDMRRGFNEIWRVLKPHGVLCSNTMICPYLCQRCLSVSQCNPSSEQGQRRALAAKEREPFGLLSSNCRKTEHANNDEGVEGSGRTIGPRR